jgi:hypothetical protein
VQAVDGVAARDVPGEVLFGRSGHVAARQGEQEAEVRLEVLQRLVRILAVHAGHIVEQHHVGLLGSLAVQQLSSVQFDGTSRFTSRQWAGAG